VPGPIGEAFVDVRPDFRNFERELQTGLKAGLRVVETQASETTENIEDEFRELARQANLALGRIGDSGEFQGIAAAAELVGEEIESAFSEAARGADESLGDIGGVGAFAPVTAEAELAGESVESSFQEAARQSNTHLATIGRTAALAFAGVAAGVGILGAALLGFGIVQASSLEQTTIAFKGMLGSAEAADSFIRDLQQFAATTPFEFAGLATSARQLLGVGFAAEQVIPTLTTLGNVGALLGVPQENIQGVITAIGQIRGLGKVTADNLNQIANQLPGFNARQAISVGLQRELGITAEEAAQKLETGAVDAETGIRLLLSAMNEFPGAAGAMEAQSQSLLGLFSTFKDVISLRLTEAVQPLVPALKGVLAEITPLLGSALDQIAPPLVNLAGTLLETLVGIVSAAGPALSSIFGGLADTLKILQPGFTALGSAISALAQPFADLVVAIAPFVAALAIGFGNLVDTFGPPLLNLFTTIFTALQPLIPLFAQMVDELIQATGEEFTKAFSELAVAVTDLLVALTPLLVPLTELATIFLTLSIQGLTDTINILAKAIEIVIPVVEFLVGAFQTAIDKLGPFGDVLKIIGITIAALVAGPFTLVAIGTKVISEVFSHLGDVLRPIGDFLSGVFTTVWQALSAFFTDTVPGAIQTVGDAFQSLQDNVLSPLGAFIGETLQPVWDALVQAWNESVKPAIDDIAGALLALWQNVLVPVGDFLGTTFTVVWGFLSAVFTGVLVPALQAAITALTWLWQNILTPIWDFISANVIPILQVLAAVFLGPLVIAVQAVIAALTWLWQNVLSPVWDFISGNFIPIIQALLLTFVGPLVGAIAAASAAFSFLWNGILTPFANFVQAGFSIAIGIGRAALTGLQVVAGIVGSVISSLFGVARQVADFFQNAFSAAIGVAKSAWNGFASIINGIVDALRAVVTAAGRAADAISNLPGAGVVKKVGGFLNPFGAEGGIFDSPTAKIIGEAGREVLLPLTDPARTLALAQQSGLFDTLARAVPRSTANVIPFPTDRGVATGGDHIELNLFFAANTTPQQADSLTRSAVDAVEDERKKRRAQLEARIA